MYVGQCFGYNCILGECYALWCECEQSGRQYCKPRQILAEQHRQEETVLGALFCDSVAFVLPGIRAAVLAVNRPSAPVTRLGLS